MTSKTAMKIIGLGADKRTPPIALRWRPHEVGGAVKDIRVWRNNWTGDTFEILTVSQFNELSRFCKMFNIPLVDYTDED